MAVNTDLQINPGLQRMPETPREWVNWMNELAKFISDATALAVAQAAQTQADLSGHSFVGANFVWNSDTAGTFTAGNPTRDLVAYIYDEDGTQVASRTLRGTLTSAAGTIAVTAVSTTGETTTYSLTNDGTASVQATVIHTASQKRGTLSWSAVDESTAGGTPASGGGK